MALTRLSLLERLRDPRNVACWNEFAKEYSRIVDDYARPYCRSEHDQGDIVQNVWLSLFRVLPRFEYQAGRGGFHRWLKRIVRNTAIDWFRRRKRDPQVSEIVDHLPMASVTESGDDDQQLILKRAMEMIRQQSNPLVWRCFEQHLLGERPAREVAEELHISSNAVYVNASRVAERVRSMGQFLQGAIRES